MSFGVGMSSRVAKYIRLVIASIVSWHATHGLAEEMTISGPRPLAQAAEKLGTRFQVPITYEDPPYQFQEESEDTAADSAALLTSLVPTAGPTIITALKPRELRFTYSVSSTSIGREAQAQEALQRALEVNNRDNPPAIFELRRSGERLHISPRRVRNRLGHYVLYQSLLDLPISVEPTDRSALELVDLLCSAVSRASETPFEVGSINLGYWRRQRSALGGQNVPARELLLELLAELESRAADGRLRFSWSLLGDSAGAFALNFYTLTLDSSDRLSAKAKLPSNVTDKTRVPLQNAQTGAMRQSSPPGAEDGMRGNRSR